MPTFSNAEQKSLVRGTGHHIQDMVNGPVNFYLRKMTMGSTENYTTGGFAFAASGRLMEVVDAEAIGSKGHPARYNASTEKIQIFDSGGSGMAEMSSGATRARSEIFILKVFEARG